MYAHCSKCGELKERLIYKRYKNEYKYSDEKGRRWSGTVCPDCYAASRLTGNPRGRPPKKV